MATTTTNVCARCGEDRPEQFYRDSRRPTGLTSRCKSCMRATRKPTSQKGRYSKKSQLKHRYGVSIEQYDEMLVRQSGVCAICEEACDTGRSLAVDHCHETGRVRGLLCNRCNRALGGFQDNPELLMAARQYLLTSIHGA